MCSGSHAMLRDKSVDVYMGYHGGNFTVDSVGENCACFRVDSNGVVEGKEEVRKLLMKHKKAEIVEMVLELIENADEG